jgi:hypothetical protein
MMRLWSIRCVSIRGMKRVAISDRITEIILDYRGTLKSRFEQTMAGRGENRRSKRQKRVRIYIGKNDLKPSG